MIGESNLRTFMELMIFEIVIVSLVASYGAYNTEINCASVSTDYSNPYNESPNVTMTETWNFLDIFNPQCSGMPGIIWILIIVIPLITVGVYVAPFIGG